LVRRTKADTMATMIDERRPLKSSGA